MMAIQVTEVAKRPSWSSHIIGLMPGGEFTADYSKRNTINPLISGIISLKYPDRKFRTRKEVIDGKEYLIVKRIK